MDIQSENFREQNDPCKIILSQYITEIEDRHSVQDYSKPPAQQPRHRTDTVYLLSIDGNCVVLGSGRYASVVLGADRSNYMQANTQFFAVKFFKEDLESTVASKIRSLSLLRRNTKTMMIPADEGAFVAYKGFPLYKSHKAEEYDAKPVAELRLDTATNTSSRS